MKIAPIHFRAIDPGKAFQFVVCLFTGILSGAVILLNLPDKWKFGFIMVLLLVNLVIAINPTHVLLFLIASSVPIYLVKGIISFPRPVNVGLSTGIGVSHTEVMVLLLLLVFLATMKSRNIKVSFFPSITLPALAWIGVSSLSLFNSRDVTLSLMQLIYMCSLFVIYLIFANCIREKIDLKWVIAGLITGMLFEAALGIFEGIFGHPLGLSFVGEGLQVDQQTLDIVSFSRVQGTLGHPNSFAMYLASAIPFSLGLFFIQKKVLRKILIGLTFCIGGLGLLFSLSRSGWVNLLIIITFGLLVWVIKGRIKFSSAFIFSTITGLIILGLVFFGPNFILLRLTANDNGSAASRLDQAATAFKVIQDHPILGIGLNNYYEAMAEYNPAFYSETHPAMVHDVYLFIASETGLLGLAAFLWFLAALFLNAWRVFIRSKDDFLSAVSIGLFSGVLALAVHGLTDYGLLGDGHVTAQLFVLASIIAVIGQSEFGRNKQKNVMVVGKREG